MATGKQKFASLTKGTSAQRVQLRTALHYTRKHRLERLAAQEAEEPPPEDP